MSFNWLLALQNIFISFFFVIVFVLMWKFLFVFIYQQTNESCLEHSLVAVDHDEHWLIPHSFYSSYLYGEGLYH